MEIFHRILKSEEIHKIIPLVDKLNSNKVPQNLLYERFEEMVQQNYECAVMCDGEKIVGVAGLWYCTRHYVGKTVEVDHVYIDEGYRNFGFGKTFMQWIEIYITSKGCNSMELNTYVQNYPSHKFYYNLGFEILGYHFLKRCKKSN